MSRIIFSIVMLIGIIAADVYGQSDDQVKKYVTGIAKKHTRNAYEILNQEEARLVSSWFGKTTSKFDISKFGTAVHESLHGYDHEIGSAKGYDWNKKMWHKGYFIDRGIKIVMPQHKVFKTAKLHKNFFPQAVKNLSRYGTYIHEKPGEKNWVNDMTAKEMKERGVDSKEESTASSNLSGFYGLLEEFNAYYHDMRAQFEIMKSGMDYYRWGSSTNTADSYYEFNIFMAYYLKYAKEKEPEDYKKIIAQKELRTAYTLIENNWRDLMTALYADKKYGKYYPITAGEDHLFTKELRKIMSDFMLDDTELEKYKAFLSTKKYDEDMIAKKHKETKDDSHLMEEGYDTWDDSRPEDGSENNDDIWDGKSGEYSIDITFRDRNKSYVVVKGHSDIMVVFKYYAWTILPEFKDAGIYTEKKKYYVYLKSFSSKTKAIEFANKNKRRYPAAKVI